MKKTISFIIPVYNEEENIEQFINQLKKIKINKYKKEIIVIDNNSTDSSKNKILKTKIKYFSEKKIGYGYAIKKGLNLAKGDLLVTIEPDNTFEIKDVYKFLNYIDYFDCVFGTRTSKSTIGSHAKMGKFLRYGNIFVAKTMEYLFFGPTLSDVGCTFKMFKKNIYKKIRNKIFVNDSAFQAELMIRLIQLRCKIVEIPIFYNKRIGYSKITYNFISSFLLGIKMIFLIFKNRLICK
jgi:glycosyltransferase involved in cell wall biosynthesis